jgi:hypothetical protein
MIGPEIQYVLFADIAGFYENIDLRRLSSDLNEIKFTKARRELAMTFLKRWAHPRGKGIPQVSSASDILAKIYLNPIDQALRNAGYAHLRYVDDIRIFCRSELEAKRALLCLDRLLRDRGLNLHSAKTEILDADQARNKIDGISPYINKLSDKLKSDYALYIGTADYVRLSDFENIVRLHPDAPSPQVLERAFTDNFILPDCEKYNKTLLRYLVNRLGKTKSTVAVKYCLAQLACRPEETLLSTVELKTMANLCNELSNLLRVQLRGEWNHERIPTLRMS